MEKKAKEKKAMERKARKNNRAGKKGKHMGKCKIHQLLKYHGGVFRHFYILFLRTISGVMSAGVGVVTLTTKKECAAKSRGSTF